MGAVAEMAERMIVMYAGRNAEQGPVEAIIDHPRHPYTKGLISCVPHIVANLTDERVELTEVPGIRATLAGLWPRSVPVCVALRAGDARLSG
jgi:ABC-type dipeptide/oligopeptide/nickel transport system ATPase component